MTRHPSHAGSATQVTVTIRSPADAFEYPYRGKPIESFPLGKKGIEGLTEQERLVFSIEADLELSEAVVYGVNRQIR